VPDVISFESYRLGTHPHMIIRLLYLTTKVLSGITAFVAAFQIHSDCISYNHLHIDRHALFRLTGHYFWSYLVSAGISCVCYF